MQALCSEPPDPWSLSSILPSPPRPDGLSGQAPTQQSPNLQHWTQVQGQEGEGKGTGEERVDFGWVGPEGNPFAGQRAAGTGLPPRVGLTLEETLSLHSCPCTLLSQLLGDEGSKNTEGFTPSYT